MPTDTAEIKRYIEAHLKHIRTPQEVAQPLGHSYETLRKDFKRIEGITLGRFITQARIQRIKQYLVTTNLLCSEISYRVGFVREDVAARAFKRETGLSMQAYRQRYRESR